MQVDIITRNVLTRISYKIRHKEELVIFEVFILIALHVGLYNLLIKYLQGRL